MRGSEERGNIIISKWWGNNIQWYKKQERIAEFGYGGITSDVEKCKLKGELVTHVHEGLLGRWPEVERGTICMLFVYSLAKGMTEMSSSSTIHTDRVGPPAYSQNLCLWVTVGRFRILEVSEHFILFHFVFVCVFLCLSRTACMWFIVYFVPRISS